MSDPSFCQGLGSEGQTRGFVLRTICREHGLLTSVPFPNTDPAILDNLKQWARQVDSILYGCPEEDLRIEVKESNAHSVSLPSYGRGLRVKR